MLEFDHADIRPGFGLALFEHFGFGVDGVTVKGGVGADDSVIANSGENRPFGQVSDAQTGDQPKDENPIDDALPELRMRGIIFIDMQRLGVHRQRAEHDVQAGVLP